MQHFHQALFGRRRKILWNFEFAFLDILVENLDVVVVVRRYADKHFVEDYANLVDVASLGHSLFLQHLWCQIGGRATKRLRSDFLTLLALFSQSKISQPYVALRVKKQIFRLEISEENTLLMKALKT